MNRLITALALAIVGLPAFQQYSAHGNEAAADSRSLEFRIEFQEVAEEAKSHRHSKLLQARPRPHTLSFDEAPAAGFVAINAIEWRRMANMRRQGSLPGQVRIQDFPLGNDWRVTLDLQPFEVLSRDGLIVAGTKDGDLAMDVELGLHFSGSVREIPASFVYIAVMRHYAHGYIDIPARGQQASERFYIMPTALQENTASTMIVCRYSRYTKGSLQPDDFCGAESLPSYLDWEKGLRERKGTMKGSAGDKLQSYEALLATVAVDCDEEFLADHDNSFARAVNYALSLFAGTSAIFKRDINCAIRVNYLRVWTDDDPYVNTSRDARHDEFEDYWNANMDHVRRSHYHLISGRNFGGLAAVNALCGGGKGGAALSGTHGTLVFPLVDGYHFDLAIVPHETGHIFGSPHTHACSWDPPIDTCVSISCATTTSPKKGTIMSYCHLTPFDIEHEFHPRVRALMRPIAEDETCVLPPEGNFAKDVAVLAIESPMRGGAVATTASITPRVVYKNIGTQDQNSLTLTFSIKTTNATISTISQTLASLDAGEQVTVTFSALTIVTSSVYEAVAGIELSGDEHDFNNVLAMPFEVDDEAIGSLTLTAPNSTASYTAGTSLVVSWTSSSVSKVRIEYSLDNGIAWSDVSSELDAADLSFTWSVVSQRSTQARIRISDWDNPELNDVSDAPFSIAMSNDIAVSALLAPDIRGVLIPPLQAAASFSNVGSTTQSSIPVRLRIVRWSDKQVVVNETKAIGSLAPGQTASITFSTTGLMRMGDYLLYITTELNGDMNSANDELVYDFSIGLPPDRIEGHLYHTLAVDPADGGVWAWGRSHYDMLGNGSTLSRRYPVRVRGLRDVARVGAGLYHSLAVQEDGSLWAWGRNNYGQLGDGSTTQRATPVEISLLGAIADVAAGAHHSAAIYTTGIIWTWGRNNYGQLGDGTTTDRSSPDFLFDLSGAIAVDCGYYQTYVLQGNGSVWSWGRNAYGELGDGTTTERHEPVEVNTTATFSAIAAGRYHVVALTDEGTVLSWGRNNYGQLGDGTNTNRSSPVPVTGLSGVVQIAAGRYHSYALTTNGTVYAWGRNNRGQLGDGTTTDRNAPVEATTASGAIVLYDGGDNSFFVRDNSEICASGYNNYGQLGDYSNSDKSSYGCMPPLAVSSKWRVTGGGYDHSIAMKINAGTVWAWGRNNQGQLGDGTTTDSFTEVQVSGLSDVVAVASGSNHNFAIKKNGELWAWGDGANGKLGIGSTSDQSTAMEVTALSDVVGVSGGVSHSVVLRANGTAWAMGKNASGQLGDGTTTQRTSPVKVDNLSDLVSVAAGFDYSMALKEDGTVWSWGENGSGQLGDGSTTDRSTPVRVGTLTDIVMIAAGQNHGIALQDDGAVWAWGANLVGEVGDGTQTQRTSPVQVSSISDVVQIARGASQSYAVKSDGSVWGWGLNAEGELGDGSFNWWRTTPVQATSASLPFQLGDTQYHALLHALAGEVCASGENSHGEIGDGTTVNRNVFTCSTTSYLKADPGADAAQLQLTTPGPDEGLVELHVYPNPNEGRFQVALSTGGKDRLSIAIVDALGRTLALLPVPNGEGVQHLSVKLETPAAGLYFLRLYNERQTLVSRLVVVR